MKNIVNECIIKKNPVRRKISNFIHIPFFSSVKYQQKFFEIYQSSYIQLRAIEQQRLLAIRDQMRLAIDLTLFDRGLRSRDYPIELFVSFRV